MNTEIDITSISAAVRRLGDHFLSNYRKTPIPSTKAELLNQLSAIDTLCTETLQGDLAILYPHIPWKIGDEFSETGQRTPENFQEYWLCDAMDGAIQYLQHVPGWSVNLVLIRNGGPHLSMIYAPLENDLYHALENGGAFLNGQSITPSTKTDPGAMLAVFDYGHQDEAAYDPDLNGLIGRQVSHLLDNFGIVRNYGPHGIQLASVGAGRIDLFVQQGLDTFNWLAGLLIAKEAGAEVRTIQGEPWFWGADSIIVGSAQATRIFLNSSKKS